MSLARLLHGRRASVAVWIAVMMPGLFMAVALGVEAASWAAAQVSVQRSADVSAIAGGIVCSVNGGCKTPATQQAAATFAARMAQLNGGTGTAAPSWNSGTSTLSDNMITAQIVSGYVTSTDAALKVTVQKTIPATVSKVFNSTGSYTVTGTGFAEVITRTGGGSGGQPCILLLSTSSPDITLSGSTAITATGCTIRSNSNLTGSGSFSITAAAFYEAGASNTTSGSPSFSPAPTFNSGTLGDPYASNSAVLTAIGQLGAGGTTISLSGATTQTINPGSYAGWSLSGSSKLTLNPGLYIINGSVSSSGTAAIDGSSGVTIVTSGTFSFSGSGSGKLTLVAPNNTSTGGVVPGVAVISTGSSVSMSGSATITLTGVFYAPHATLSFSGTAMASTVCQEFIANSVTFSGSAALSSGGCAGMGALTFSSLAGTTTTAASIVH